MGNLRGWEWLLVVALVLLLFGAKRLPDAARGLGRSLRIFKAETKGLRDEEPSAEQPPALAGTLPGPGTGEDAIAHTVTRSEPSPSTVDPTRI